MPEYMTREEIKKRFRSDRVLIENPTTKRTLGESLSCELLVRSPR